MIVARVALAAGVLVVAVLATVLAVGIHGALTPLLTIAALAVLIAGGNLLYGRNSHAAQAQARIRPAQEARNREIDEARRRAAEQAAATDDENGLGPSREEPTG
ncbi:MAG TPA: hypothetical protein VNG12_22100 [Acidimicrobiales bacterium]|nr:hypothetical protein [Acidimicrobiales bacterium]